MEELVVESVTLEDFLLIKRVLETYNINIKSEISYEEIQSVYKKITDIVTCFEDK